MFNRGMIWFAEESTCTAVGKIYSVLLRILVLYVGVDFFLGVDMCREVFAH